MHIDQTFTKASGGFFELPSVWVGNEDRDGDAVPWSSACVGSVYIYNNVGTAATIYFKKANAGADADWEALNT